MSHCLLMIVDRQLSDGQGRDLVQVKSQSSESREKHARLANMARLFFTAVAASGWLNPQRPCSGRV